MRTRLKRLAERLAARRFFFHSAIFCNSNFVLIVFEKFDVEGKLLLPDVEVSFDAIPWSKHPTFPGVELKHIITSEKTDGQFSSHLVRIAPNRKSGNHIHEKQLETHEVISGAGTCVNDGVPLPYEAGVISIFSIGVPHEVIAEDDLYVNGGKPTYFSNCFMKWL